MRIKLASDGTPTGTQITDAAGLIVRGIKSVTWMCQVGEPAKAFVELSLIELQSVEAEAEILVGGRAVRRIEYADGTIDEFPRTAGKAP